MDDTTTVRPTADDRVRDARRSIPPGFVQGRDGKHYRYRPLSRGERDYLAGRVHYLRHDDGLTVRGIVAALAGEGITVSVGTVHGLLRTRRCDACSGGQVPHLNSGVQAFQTEHLNGQSTAGRWSA